MTCCDRFGAGLAAGRFTGGGVVLVTGSAIGTGGGTEAVSSAVFSVSRVCACHAGIWEAALEARSFFASGCLE